MHPPKSDKSSKVGLSEVVLECGPAKGRFYDLVPTPGGMVFQALRALRTARADPPPEKADEALIGAPRAENTDARASCLTAIAGRNNFANIASIPSPPQYLGLCILPHPLNPSLTLPERPIS
jgi:hypothetical protein